MNDRNGTDIVVQAIKLLREPCTITLRTQDPSLPPIKAPTHVQVRVSTGGLANYWDLYADADALVMPRRYGGLCLPVQEAMASGSGGADDRHVPERRHRGRSPPCRSPTASRSGCRAVAVCLSLTPTRPLSLPPWTAFADPAERHALQARSVEWAQRNSWEALTPNWLDRFRSASR